MDFRGPTNSGEYLLVLVCKQTRWFEVEFVSSTSAIALISKLDWIFFSLGIPVSVDSKNEPLFNGQEFKAFSKYLGFQQE